MEGLTAWMRLDIGLQRGDDMENTEWSIPGKMQGKSETGKWALI